MTKPHLASRCPRLFPAVIAAWLAVLAAPGQAANVSGTFVGVMDAGSIDVQGYFGAANTNYSGMTISGAYAYDTANLAPNSCLVIPGEACFLGTVSISVTIAGAGTLTFPGTPASSPYGIVQYGGFPASSSGIDEFNIFSYFAGPPPIGGTITVEFYSSTVDFVPDPLDITSSFTLAPADLHTNGFGSMNLPLTGGGGESLSFRFTGPSAAATRTSDASSTDMPEPGSLLLAGSALVALTVARRRRCRS